MNESPQPIDIKKIEVAELYKLCFEQQKTITSCFAQIQQAQNNIAILEAEIATRI